MVGNILKVVGASLVGGAAFVGGSTAFTKATLNYMRSGPVIKTVGWSLLGWAGTVVATVGVVATVDGIDRLLRTPEVQQIKRKAKDEVREEVVKPLEQALSS